MARQLQEERPMKQVLLISKLAGLNKLHPLKLNLLQLKRFKISLHTLEVHLLTIGKLFLKNNNGSQEQIILHKQMLKLLNI